MEKLLKEHFGYDTFRPLQKEIIESVLSEKNTLGILPTGSGKSICFQLPGLISSGITLVISPLISLMRDQVESLNNQGISAAFLNSTLSEREFKETIIKLKSNKYKFLYVAPERFLNESFLQMLKSLNIPLIAFDEAHCISKWGHDFRPSYQEIIPIINNHLEGATRVALTATATTDVIHNIQMLLNIDGKHTFKSSVKRKNLHLKIDHTYQREQFIINYAKRHKNSVGIVYAATRAEVEKLSEVLLQNGVKNVQYHAGLNKNERALNQEKFLNEEVKLVVATNAFGMGINKKNIRYIIHNNMPGDLESYYQEIGRAGRDGKASECILLSSAKDVNLQQFFIERMEGTEKHKENQKEKLDVMVQFNKTKKCLNSFIIKYFNPDEYVIECGTCSNCLSNRRTYNMSREAKTISTAIYNAEMPLSKGLLIQMLRGEYSENIDHHSLNLVNDFGKMSGYRTSELYHIVEELIYRGYLHSEANQLFQTAKTKEIFENAKILTEPFKKSFNEKVDIKTYNMPSEVLLSQLKEVRESLAKKRKLAPSDIFSDETLKEFAKKLPETKQDMVHITGVGNYKLKHYCPEFIDTIKKYKDAR